MSADKSCAPIEIRNVTRNFGAVRALDGLDLTVREGEVHGFLGPNGAGKSTTIRVLLGIVKADSGTARLLGADPWTDAVELHRQIAYVPTNVTLWPPRSPSRCHCGCTRRRPASGPRPCWAVRSAEPVGWQGDPDGGRPVGARLLLGLVFVVPGLIVLALRISDEEQLLRQEMNGYREYTQRVRYRLVPYVW